MALAASAAKMACVFVQFPLSLILKDRCLSYCRSPSHSYKVTIYIPLHASLDAVED